jgi:hypothetical protein
LGRRSCAKSSIKPRVHHRAGVLGLPRAMASALGVSKATVQRVWSHNKIKPHLTRVFKLSTDPDFEAKFWDVIGLYLNPSERQWCSVMTKKVRSRPFAFCQPRQDR